MDLPTPGGPILSSTHDGLWTHQAGNLTATGPTMDSTGFTVLDDTTLRASGHAGPGSDLVDPTGLTVEFDGSL